MSAAQLVSADALDDGLLLEDGFLSDASEAIAVEAIEEATQPAEPEKSTLKREGKEKRGEKRKRAKDDAEPVSGAEKLQEPNGESQLVPERKGKKGKSKTKAGDKGKGSQKAADGKGKRKASTLPAPSESEHESVSIGLHPPDMQYLFLADKQKRALPRISNLELDGLRLNEAWLADLTGVDERAHLGAWLAKEPLPRLLGAVKEETADNGSPTVLVVASAALRVADLCREVKPLIPTPSASGAVAKLFARHLKLSEQVTFLQSHPTSIAVGTPDRLAKLLDSGALKTSRLKWIILDVTWVDAKKYSLVELPDAGVKEALWKGVLGHAGLRERLEQRQGVIALF